MDAERIRAWQTVDTLRPKGNKRAREESDDETAEVRFVKPKQELALRKAEPPPKSAAQLLAELSSDSEEEIPLPRRMLTDGPAEATDRSLPDLRDPTSVWAHRIKTEAVLVMAEIGDAPEQLHYRRCHHECRRQLLLQSKVREECKQPGVVQVMRVALKLPKHRLHARRKRAQTQERSY